MARSGRISGKYDFLIAGVAILLATLALLGIEAARKKGEGLEAVVSIDGEVVMRLALDDYRDGNETVLSLREGYGVPIDFELKDGAIRYVRVDCPDHICEKQGFIKDEYQTAVCMPNRTAVVIEKRG